MSAIDPVRAASAPILPRQPDMSADVVRANHSLNAFSGISNASAPNNFRSGSLQSFIQQIISQAWGNHPIQPVYGAPAPSPIQPVYGAVIPEPQPVYGAPLPPGFKFPFLPQPVYGATIPEPQPVYGAPIDTKPQPVYGAIIPEPQPVYGVFIPDETPQPVYGATLPPNLKE